MSIFNRSSINTVAKKKKNWAFLPPDKRNPVVRDSLGVRKIAVIRPPSKGVYQFNGVPCASFDAVKQAAKQAGYGIARMGIINVKL